MGKKIGIVGAGPVGSLLSIYLARRGYDVCVFERRPDARTTGTLRGRSINMALSNRGIRALEQVGADGLFKQSAIPMRGRLMHDVKGRCTFQPYGKEGQCIYSIARGGLNIALMDQAEAMGVKIQFEQKAISVDSAKTALVCAHKGKKTEYRFDILLAADGAYSAVRDSLKGTEQVAFATTYMPHGYKEFHIPPGPGGSFLIRNDALHIWPRKNHMLVALPNPDGSFTCTLFLPYTGPVSYEHLNNESAISDFFGQYFPDAKQLMPALIADFTNHPVSSLAVVRCYPWVSNNTLLIGDAAHAIVPFYGQGLNCGFEDCRILDSLLTEYNDDWGKTLIQFQKIRKPDADAIATLAMDNFKEMSERVASDLFLLRKKVEARLYRAHPDKWVPEYNMVTFEDGIRYSDALRRGETQRAIMDEVMENPDIANFWNTLDTREIIAQLS